MASPPTTPLLAPQSSVSPQAREDLPDLTDRLVQLGVYQQYAAFRDGYRRWRQGGSQGAKGDPAGSTSASAEETFRYLYPDEVSIQFREVIAYWIDVLFIEGSILFAFSGLFGAMGKRHFPRLGMVLTRRPAFAGAICFTIGTYLVYLEVINIGITRDSKMRYLSLEWTTLRQSYHLQPSTLIGGLAYCVGAAFYQVACTAELWAEAIPKHAVSLLITIPTFLGGVLFVVGGACSLVQVRVLSSPPTTLVWWVSMFNFMGDACFLVGGIPHLLSEFQEGMCTFIGAVMFAAGATMALGMWKVGQFGGALLQQLNDVARTKAIPIVQRSQDGAVIVLGSMDEPTSMSPRGIGFILVFALSGAVSIINCCFIGMHPKGEIRDLNMSAQEVMNACIVHMGLILTSAGFHRAPKGQPLRLLYFAMRALVSGLLVHGISTSTIFLTEVAG